MRLQDAVAARHLPACLRVDTSVPAPATCKIPPTMKPIFLLGAIALLITTPCAAQTLADSSTYSGWARWVMVGTVVTEEEGRPLPRAIVQIPGTRYMAFTDSLGRYRFQGLEAGRYRVLVSAIGYYRESRDIAYGQHATCIRCPVSSMPVRTLNFRMRPQDFIESR